ncbi:hypothetical protein LA6_000030 [Marinibacterium anthonyi]|nr:hypothetical protein LA6_000030 [Marinibacterium anthonyi]
MTSRMGQMLYHRQPQNARKTPCDLEKALRGRGHAITAGADMPKRIACLIGTGRTHSA